ncbi:hypothetical protein R1flu_018915 [Riccia fluitans]|uniref:Uncharacterized protein n=1 Tax=Riccia fluitans TaxID=41844 RepID=A0ABD1ZHE7_9MARC
MTTCWRSWLPSRRQLEEWASEPKANPGDAKRHLFTRQIKTLQHNVLAFYHHAWVAITNPTAPTPDWGDAVEKTVSRQIKGLGVCNEATCLGPYLAHLYNHFHEMDAKEKEASIQTISDSDTETKPEDEKESSKEVPRVFCEDKASGSKLLDQKLDFAKWENRVESLGRKTFRLFEVFYVEIASVTADAVARNMKEMFAPPPVVETDLQPWKETVRNLVDLLTKEDQGGC